MVRKSGHMFHIDFGRILGNAQMFGSIKRDRVPFVLTPDMAYVINAGDKPSVRFQKFTDLCCSAFNELRKHSHLFLSVLSLVSTVSTMKPVCSGHFWDLLIKWLLYKGDPRLMNRMKTL